MLNVSGVVRVMNLKKISKNLTVGTIYSGFKKSKDEWGNVFIECKFVGDALVDAKKIGLKEKVDFVIESAVLGQDEWEKEGKKYHKPVLTIFKIAKHVKEEMIAEDNGDMPF